jgi:3-isopropylmalate dehydrogenase
MTQQPGSKPTLSLQEQITDIVLKTIKTGGVAGDRTGDIFSPGMNLLGCKAMGAALLQAMEA